MAILDTFLFGLNGERIKDEQLQNMWILTFNKLPDFNFYIESTNLPLYGITQEKLATTDLILPTGKDNYRSVSITYRETKDFQGFKFHKSWLFQEYNFSQRVVKKTFHTSKKTATIKFVSNEPEGIIQNAIFTLSGMTFVGFEDIQLSNDSGEPLTFTCQYEIEGLTSVFDRIKII